MTTLNTVVPGAKNGMKELTWMQESRNFLGTTEIPGTKHNPVILGFWKAIGISWGVNDEIAWCAAFTGAMLKRAGLKYLETGLARNYTDYVRQTKTGKKLDKPYYGCIVVMWSGSPKGTQGHIGFCAGVQEGNPDNLMILAGNQGNRVGIDPFPKSRVLAYIWPSISPTPQRAELPVLKYLGKGEVGTR